MPDGPHIGLDLLYLQPGATGGMEVYARRLVPLLPEVMPAARFTVFAGRELAAEWRQHPWHPSIGLIELPISSAGRIGRTAAQQTLVALAARRAGIDLLHSLGNIAPLLGVRRRVVTIHDLIFLRYPETTSGVLAKGLAALVPQVARRATRIIADSEATAADLKQMLSVPEQKIDVVPIGPGKPPSDEFVDDEPLRQQLGLGAAPIVLSVSARRPHKNLERLIEAMVSLPDAQLVLPGYPSPFDQHLAAHAAAHGVGNRVHMCAWVSDEQLEGLYRAATCLAFPSLAEGFGLPVLEAMARGLPVATSGQSALAEVAGDAALLFDPLDVSSIAEQVGRLLAEPALRAELRELGLRQAAQFTWQRAAEGTAAAYLRSLD